MQIPSIIFVLLMTSSALFGKDLVVNDRLEIERRIEQYLHEVIEKHVASDKFFLSVRVTLPVQSATDTEEAPASGDGIKSLPYTPLKVDLTFLSSLLKGGKVPDKFTDRVDTYEVRLTFDESVPADTVKLIEERITYQLDINNNNRKIVSSKALLKVETPKVADPNKAAEIQLESARLENQRTKLEMERQKLETQKQMERLKDELKKIGEAKKDEPEKPADKTAEEKAAAAVPEKAPASLGELIKDYQPLIMAVLFVVFGIIGVFLFSGSHKTGLSKVSAALGGLGEALGKSAAADAAVSDALETKPDAVSSTVQDAAATGGDAGSSDRDERFDKFIKLVEEKIEVLSNEGNFNFYRHFLDLMQDNLKYAAALLVSVSDASARKLLQNIAPDALARLQDYLGESGAHTEARSLRTKALQDFYGRIAMDEYLDSPLASVKDATWLVKMSTEELSQFVISLEESDRIELLACLTPTRIAMMLEELTDNAARQKLVASIKNVEKANPQSIDALFAKLQKIYKTKDAKLAEKTRSLVDGPRFFARIVTDLKPGTRDEFLKMLEDRQDIMDGLKNFYIPFSDLKNIAENILKDIFSKRSASQVAKIIYAADVETRNCVISVMPEMLRDTVKEDLEVLDNDQASAKKNVQISQNLQEDICRYLLKLNKEGLLDYRDGPDLKAVPDPESDTSAA